MNARKIILLFCITHLFVYGDYILFLDSKQPRNSYQQNDFQPPKPPIQMQDSKPQKENSTQSQTFSNPKKQDSNIPKSTSIQNKSSIQPHLQREQQGIIDDASNTHTAHINTLNPKALSQIPQESTQDSKAKPKENLAKIESLQKQETSTLANPTQNLKQTNNNQIQDFSLTQEESILKSNNAQSNQPLPADSITTNKTQIKENLAKIESLQKQETSTLANPTQDTLQQDSIKATKQTQNTATQQQFTQESADSHSNKEINTKQRQNAILEAFAAVNNQNDTQEKQADSPNQKLAQSQKTTHAESIKTKEDSQPTLSDTNKQETNKQEQEKSKQQEKQDKQVPPQSLTFAVINGTTFIATTSQKNPATLHIGKKKFAWIAHPTNLSKQIAFVPIHYRSNIGKIDIGNNITLDIQQGNYPREKITIIDTNKVSPDNTAKELIAKELAQANKIYTSYTSKRYWSEPFIYPMSSKITSPFGSARVFNNEVKSFHSGTDFKAKKGTPIHASNSGVVVLAQERFLAGKSVIIDHGEGVFSSYYHCDEISVKVGRKVRKGDVVALSGDTGRVSGPHLHFGMFVNGVQVDPINFIESVNKLFE